LSAVTQASLKAIQRLIYFGKSVRGTPDGHIPLYAPTLYLIRALRTDAGARVSPRQFDQFLQVLKISHQESDHYAFARARLMFYHPKDASGAPMLEFFKHYPYTTPVGRFTENLLEAPTGSRLVMFFHAVVRAAQHLEGEGRQNDTLWLLDFARKRRPDVVGETATFKPRSEDTTGVTRMDGMVPEDVMQRRLPGNTLLPHERIHQDIWRARRRMDEQDVRGARGPREKPFRIRKTW